MRLSNDISTQTEALTVQKIHSGKKISFQCPRFNAEYSKKGVLEDFELDVKAQGGSGAAPISCWQLLKVPLSYGYHFWTNPFKRYVRASDAFPISNELGLKATWENVIQSLVRVVDGIDGMFCSLSFQLAAQKKASHCYGP